VSIFGRSPLPLREVLGPEIAGSLHSMHAEHGVTMHPNSRVVEVSGGPGAYLLRTAEGGLYRASHVVAGVGIDPETDWLARSGVAVDGGVLCGPDGRTSVLDVYAAGDVARREGNYHRPGHWTGAIDQGCHVAHNLVRNERKAYEAVPYFWTTQYHRKYCCYGRVHTGDRTVVIDGDLEGEFLALFTDGVEFHGVVSCGRERLLRGYKKLLQRGAGLAEALELAGINDPTAVATIR
jgi:3-phenylpropionate/trans-cinnamate dioxygenase ferredoxin reductase subunit